MNKVVKFIIRIFFFFLILGLVLFGIDLLLKYKNEKKNYIDYYDNGRLIELNSNRFDIYKCSIDSLDCVILRDIDDKLTEKQPNKKRILIVGDSFVVGPMNNNSNTIYWKKLQRIFEENGYNDVEILAAGRCGMSTYEQMEYIFENERLIKKVNPDLIILAFLSNDWDVFDSFNKFYIPKFNFYDYVDEYLSDGIYKIFKTLYPNLYDWYINYKITNMTSDKDFNKKYGSIYGYNYNDLFELEKDGLIVVDEFMKQYEENTVKKLAKLEYPFMVFNEIFPSNDYFEAYFGEKALELFDKYNIDILNYEEKYNLLSNEHTIGELMNNEYDYHPSEILNNFYANELYNYLVDNYRNVLGNKSEIKNFDVEINDYYPYMELNLKKLNNYKYDFTWPCDDAMLYYWTNTHTIKLNLKYPMKLSELKLSGEFKNARIWINPENGQDEYIELQNEKNTFEILEDRKVASINIHVEADIGTIIELEIKK